MNYLEQLGLGDVCEDEDFFMYLMQHTCENGEVFRGYYGYYVWYRWFDILEFNCHIEPYGDSNRLRGFTSVEPLSYIHHLTFSGIIGI